LGNVRAKSLKIEKINDTVQPARKRLGKVRGRGVAKKREKPKVDSTSENRWRVFQA